MDHLKDTPNNNHPPALHEGQDVRTNPFGRNKSGERLYNRAERVVAALHLLTSHIPHDEPARVRVRSEGVRLLSRVLELRDSMRILESAPMISVQASVRELISLTRILNVAGYISIQNANAVSGALDELGNYLVSLQKSSLSESLALTKEDLLGQGEKRASVRNTSVTDQSSSVREQSDRSEVDNGQAIRSEKILEVLKSHGNLGIKDIASNLPEYSEKMIQRELAILAATGKVLKAGLKRWSRYSIVQ